MIETDLEINMPSSLDSTVDDIMWLITLFKNIEQNEVKQVTLNYKNTMFFASELYCLYHYLLDDLGEKGFEITGINVLGKVDYIMHLSKSNYFTDPKYVSSIQHRDFSLELDSGNINCFDIYLKNEFLPKMINNENVSNIITSYLSELFVNARTHGKTHKIRCNGQKYNNGKILKFIIVDFGVTIPYNVSNHIINNKLNYFHNNDGEAIRWASKEGNTTKEKLGGLGLNDLSQFIKKYNGRIKIISRNGYYELNPYRDKILFLNEKFNGTLILVELDLERISKMLVPQRTREKFEI